MNTPRRFPLVATLSLLLALSPLAKPALADDLDFMTNPSERAKSTDDVDRVISPEERKKYTEMIRTIIVNAFVAEIKKLDADEKAKAEFIEIIQSADFNKKVLLPRVERGASLMTMRDINSIQRGGQLTAPTMKKITELLSEVGEAMIATYKAKHNLK